jgi:glycosyltransferase involved in cell wall biosynthesis
MKLSVAMCTYNGAQYIEKQLLSILNQELPINEIVICDDGSNDDTLEKVENIAANYQDVAWKILQNAPQLGVTKNFEKAITLCTGDIIFLSDQDDI